MTFWDLVTRLQRIGAFVAFVHRVARTAQQWRSGRDSRLANHLTTNPGAQMSRVRRLRRLAGVVRNMFKIVETVQLIADELDDIVAAVEDGTITPEEFEDIRQSTNAIRAAVRAFRG